MEKLNDQPCQIVTLPHLCEPISFLTRGWQFRNRLWRIFKRRWIYFVKLLSGKENVIMKSRDETNAQIFRLEPGDLVRVKSRNEIKESLNRWNQLERCSFMEEMWPYCGTTQRVLKRVNQFLDERDYLIKKCKKVVILDGVFCKGAKDFGPCDRTCFFFWRDEWLEKLTG